MWLAAAQVAAKARTATYVSIDYPLMFDMLRLRLYLVKKQAADQIDDGNVRVASLLGCTASVQS